MYHYIVAFVIIFCNSLLLSLFFKKKVFMFAIFCQGSCSSILSFMLHTGSADLTASTKSFKKWLNIVVFLLFVMSSLHLCSNCTMCSFPGVGVSLIQI